MAWDGTRVGVNWKKALLPNWAALKVGDKCCLPDLDLFNFGVYIRRYNGQEGQLSVARLEV